MSLQLKAEAMPGTSIDTAAADAQRLSDLSGVCIEFKFNNVLCFVAPGGDAALLATRQQIAQSRKPKSPFDFRFASSKP